MYKLIIFSLISLIGILFLTQKPSLNDAIMNEEAVLEEGESLETPTAASLAIPQNVPVKIDKAVGEAKIPTVIKEEPKLPEKAVNPSILMKVPFSAQAPSGNWGDQRQQDACEEASSLMAIKWARGEAIDKAKAEKMILDIVAYEQENYDSYLDTSALDTLDRIIKGYFNFAKAELREDVRADDLIEELEKGNILIIPADGQKLKNPFFTAPGPERHMLVVIGYDFQKKEFITNDPGTRRGEQYRYPEKILYEAMRDYPSGFHEPISKIHKNMIIVRPE